MELLARTDEAEVAAAFMRAELESPRFRDEVLAGRRGWRIGDGVFGGFPAQLDWRRAALEPSEVLEIRYIDWDWWLMASAGSRSPVDTAKRIRAGEVEGSDAESLHALAARLRSADPPAELIAVTTHEGGPLVVVEGHVRLTAYALYPEYLAPQLEILLGISSDVAEWWAWGIP